MESPGWFRDWNFSASYNRWYYLWLEGLRGYCGWCASPNHYYPPGGDGVAWRHGRKSYSRTCFQSLTSSRTHRDLVHRSYARGSHYNPSSRPSNNYARSRLSYRRSATYGKRKNSRGVPNGRLGAGTWPLSGGSHYRGRYAYLKYTPTGNPKGSLLP